MLTVAPMGVKFGTEEGTFEGPLLVLYSTPSVQRVAPVGRKT